MAWFDGSFDYKDMQLENEFPVYITCNLRTNTEESKIAIINDFPEDSELYELSDPHMECEDRNSHVFYHAFLGEDAEKAKTFINSFVANNHGKNGYEVYLFRREEQSLFLYSYGEVHTQLPLPMEKISNCNALCGIDYFVLPLKIFMFKCPVCGEKVLQYRGMFEICEFCGWEDDGTDNIDEEGSGANGDYTIRQYREEYKRKLSMIYDIPYENLTKEQRLIWIKDNS